MRLTINDRTRDLAPEPHETLLTTLRDRLFLTGAKQGCDRGECGACTVLLNGEPVYACLTLTQACDGESVTTVEGLARGDDLHPLQDAFIAQDAVQCGFCTSGQLMAAAALLARDPAPGQAAIDEAMSGNLCRCGTYPAIVRAIEGAAAVLRGESAPGETGTDGVA
ncbi:MAG: (2Fe-2S)-binding protein [Gemmatimonadetes bacterium]|jgi:xanthine dehydrogenase YagT iron-sulfur-binding subunit|nr:(2Fe-2S)-binding protein [Gemmatimonadota bacterium]MBP9107273.1 (2Fe-2S)-binding protein [Gemmatimonadaceae bacterium]MBK8058566.1 (2Fe-2S)-binding protein [Gemmatimonadota bacterium]MBK9410601.1 (2Fe-2S)-binding protein [Gemmatimonadota bacterium]MBK9980425.1 (2Fe-2S)-binding protein [Gemmatimonadota bacterium]